jgi:glycosyltransferase involved in cell wall biosynthesis
MSVEAKASHAMSMAKTRPRSALSVAEQLIAVRPDLPHPWSAAVSISKSMNDSHQALGFARRATEVGAADWRLLLEYRKLAVTLRDEAGATRALSELVSLTPDTQAQVDQMATALRFGSLEAALEFRDRMRRERPHLDLGGLDDVVAELEIVEAAGTSPSDGVGQDVLAVARRVAAERPAGLRLAIAGLQRRHAWPELIALLSEDGGPDGEVRRDSRLPGKQLAKAASRAILDGWTHDAVALAKWALAQGEDHDRMRLIIAEGEEEERLMANGWPFPPQAPHPAYEPVPHSVLSVLGQSVPIRTGGYATRSHGILTGVAARGWEVRAATRLGFPYDLWWAEDDERVLAPVDVVDGVPYHRLLHEGVRHYPRFPLPDYVAEGATALVNLARGHRPSLIHASSLYDVGLAGLSAARRLRVPFIYEMRGLKQLLEEARMPRFRETQRAQYLDFLEASVATEADALFVITEALGREMVRLGVPEDHIVVVPNGVHSDRFSPRGRDPQLERELGVEGKTVIGYAGGFVGYEGLEVLLTAVASLKADTDGFHVVLVGDGARDRALRALARTLQIEDVVTFTGRVGHDVVDRYISLFDITPFPRLPLPVCELISPIKPFEAMAMAKAVVVSDVAALTEIVTDGSTGRSFAKGDADDLVRVLHELIDDPAQRARLGAAARGWVVAERDWSAISKTVVRAYERVLTSDAWRASTSA